MPIQSCTLSGGGKGYKFGASGKCYASRAEAIKQMKAIKWSESHSSMEWLLDLTDNEVDEILQGQSITTKIAAYDYIKRNKGSK